MSERMAGAFESLIYYPACGTANLMKMWILAGRNALYASQNRIAANALADEVQKCLEKDETIVLEYHEVDNGAFDGFGLSEHIGFVDWNSENCKYPVRNYVSPIREPRMIVVRKESAEYLTGGYWTERPQTWSDAMRNDVTEIRFEIACGSREPGRIRNQNRCRMASFFFVSRCLCEQRRNGDDYR